MSGEKLNKYMQNYYKCNPEKYKSHLKQMQHKRRLKKFIEKIEHSEMLIFRYFFLQEIINAESSLSSPENNNSKEI